MDKYLLKVESNCKDPSREDEYHHWYDDIHIPDVLETPGFVRGACYKILQPKPGQGRYIAIYEMETDNYDNLMAAHQANMKRKEAQGRMTDLFSPVSRAIYKMVES